jgi:TolA-binding protein
LSCSSDPSAAIIEELTQSLREREALLLKKDQQLQELRVQADASARNAEMMRERLHAREASVEGLRHMETKAQALSTNAQESQEKISQVSENNAREETLAACTVQGMPLMEVVCDRRSLNAEVSRWQQPVYTPQSTLVSRVRARES